jgi:hypothetical protein
MDSTATRQDRKLTPEQLLAELERAGILADGLVELRILDAVVDPRRPDWTETASGYFDPMHRLDFCKYALKDWGAETKSFVTLQRINDACLNRSVNKVRAVKKRKTTGNADIVGLVKFFLDVDSERSVKDVPASDEEKAAARTVFDAVVADLAGRGWPEPTKADSGNGFCAEWSIDLPNNKAEVDLIGRALEALGQKHDTTGGHVDVTMSDPAQLRRVPGTTNKKCEPTEERPHRPCHILSVPKVRGLVTREQLEALAAEWTDPKKQQQAKPGPAPSANGAHWFLMERYLGDYGVEFRPKASPGSRGQAIWILTTCPFVASHGKTSEVHVSQELDGQMGFACKHHECADKHWQQFREKVGPILAHHWDPPRTRTHTTSSSSNSKGADDRPADWPEAIPFTEETAPPEFPDDVLTPSLDNWARAEAVATQTPVDLPANVALATIAAGLANKFKVQVRSDWSEPVNLFVATIANSGERKSRVHTDAVAPVLQVELRHQDRDRAAVSRAKSDHRVLENKLKSLEGKAAKAADLQERVKAQREARDVAEELDRHRVPLLPQYVADDATPEKLAIVMSEQYGCVFLSSDEGTVIEIAKGRYSDDPRLEIFLKGHSGTEINQLRVGRNEVRVPNPAMTLGLTVQPDVIRGFCECASMIARGYVARFLYSWPQTLVGRRNCRPVAMPVAVAEEYRRLVAQIWDITVPEIAGRWQPHVLQFNAAAHEAMVEFSEWLEPQLPDLDHLAGWPEKLAGAVARIAGILHVADRVADRAGGSWHEPIGRETVERAIRLGRDYYLPHALVTFQAMESNPVVAVAKRILTWLTSLSVNHVDNVNGPLCVSRRDVHRAGGRAFPTADALDPVLDLLVKHYWIRPTGEGRPGRGAASPTFEVNPAVRSTNMGERRHR